jgi:hypothetical protein
MMPKIESHSSVNDYELQGVSEVSDITEVTTERPPGENACHSIDAYIFEVWQEAPPSPASRQNVAASIRSVDPTDDGTSSAI